MGQPPFIRNLGSVVSLQGQGVPGTLCPDSTAHSQMPTLCFVSAADREATGEAGWAGSLLQFQSLDADWEGHKFKPNLDNSVTQQDPVSQQNKF